MTFYAKALRVADSSFLGVNDSFPVLSFSVILFSLTSSPRSPPFTHSIVNLHLTYSIRNWRFSAWSQSWRWRLIRQKAVLWYGIPTMISHQGRTLCNAAIDITMKSSKGKTSVTPAYTTQRIEGIRVNALCNISLGCLTCVKGPALREITYRRFERRSLWHTPAWPLSGHFLRGTNMQHNTCSSVISVCDDTCVGRSALHS